MIKVKKLSLQYSYLLLEKSEKKEICSSMETKIRDMMSEEYPEKFKLIYEKTHPSNFPHNETKDEPSKKDEDIEQKTIPEQKEETSDTKDIKKIEKNPDLKKLYRKIAERTHPDKVGNNSLSHIFSDASRAYEIGNISKLVTLAVSLNIELIDLTPESIIFMEKSVETITNEINTIVGSVAWQFYIAKTHEEKIKVIKHLINSLEN